MRKVLFRYFLVPHLVVSILVCLCVFGLLAFLQVQVWSQTTQHHADLRHENEVLKRDLVQIRMRANLAEQAQDTKDALAALDEKLSTQLSQSEFVSEVSTFVRRSNIAILHSDNGIDRGREGVVWLRQELTLEGDYAGIRYFLQLIGASKHLTLIEEVDWKHGKGADQKVRIRLATLLREGT